MFALYVLLYSVGRGVIETLRIDDANRFFGVRLNVFTSILIAVGALIYLVVSARLRPGREDPATLGAARQGGAVTDGTDATTPPTRDRRRDVAEPDGRGPDDEARSAPDGARQRRRSAPATDSGTVEP